MIFPFSPWSLSDDQLRSQCFFLIAYRYADAWESISELLPKILIDSAHTSNNQDVWCG